MHALPSSHVMLIGEGVLSLYTKAGNMGDIMVVPW